MAHEPEDEWGWLNTGEFAPWQTATVGATGSRTTSALEWKRSLQDPVHDAMFQAQLREYEKRFRSEESYALFAALTLCVMWCRPLPSWAAKEIWLAYDLYRKGKLGKWDDVFGKPFPGPRRRGIDTKSKDVPIWARARQLYETEDYQLDNELWELLGKEFKMGTTNVKDAFYRVHAQSKAAASPFQIKLKPRRKLRK
jgi:hypothetical protein